MGAAAAVALLNPVSIAETLAFGLAGAVGGLVSDVDLIKSDGSKEASSCAVVVMLTVLGLLAVDTVAPFGLVEYLVANVGHNATFGIMGLMVLVSFGVSRPHREFTHSVLFMALVAICLHVTCPGLTTPVCIGVFSHLAIDVLNKRGLCLAWPFKGRFCLKVCSSGGLVDALIGIAALVGLCCFLASRL